MREPMSEVQSCMAACEWQNGGALLEAGDVALSELLGGPISITSEYHTFPARRSPPLSSRQAPLIKHQMAVWLLVVTTASCSRERNTEDRIALRKGIDVSLRDCL